MTAPVGPFDRARMDTQVTAARIGLTTATWRLREAEERLQAVLDRSAQLSHAERESVDLLVEHVDRDSLLTIAAGDDVASPVPLGLVERLVQAFKSFGDSFRAGSRHGSSNSSVASYSEGSGAAGSSIPAAPAGGAA